MPYAYGDSLPPAGDHIPILRIGKNKTLLSLCILSEEVDVHKEFSRGIVFSADLCYNKTNEKLTQ